MSAYLKQPVRVALAAALLIAVAVLLPRIVSTRADVRDITVVARGMSFYIDGSEEPNPTLKLKAGEQLRVTFRNEDGGMTHDFTIRSWGLGTKLLEGKGSDVVTLTVPSAKSTSTYQCTPHAAMMTGAVIIE
jgi:plastocyanin